MQRYTGGRLLGAPHTAGGCKQGPGSDGRTFGLGQRDARGVQHVARAPPGWRPCTQSVLVVGYPQLLDGYQHSYQGRARGGRATDGAWSSQNGARGSLGWRVVDADRDIPLVGGIGELYPIPAPRTATPLCRGGLDERAMPRGVGGTDAGPVGGALWQTIGFRHLPGDQGRPNNRPAHLSRRHINASGPTEPHHGGIGVHALGTGNNGGTPG